MMADSTDRKQKRGRFILELMGCYLDIQQYQSVTSAAIYDLIELHYLILVIFSLAHQVSEHVELVAHVLK